jgi:hypothetical protein
VNIGNIVEMGLEVSVDENLIDKLICESSLLQ